MGTEEMVKKGRKEFLTTHSTHFMIVENYKNSVIMAVEERKERVFNNTLNTFYDS